MNRTEVTMVEELTKMMYGHLDMIRDNLENVESESDELEVAQSHVGDLQKVLDALIDYAEHFIEITK